MRSTLSIVTLAVLCLLAAGCRGTQPYTAQDLAQVKQGLAEIRPTYLLFKAAYKSKHTAEMLRLYAQEQQQCKLVDQIDNRDTIDPTVNLFYASYTLDSWCNDIEAVYALWAKAHGRPFDKTLATGKVSEHFADGNSGLKSINKLMRHPSALA